MKKLILTAAAIAVAAVTQAATVSWTISNVQTAEGTKLTDGHVYMFFTTGDASAAVTAIKALAEKGVDSFSSTLASANWNDTKKATAAGNFSLGTSAALGGYTLPTNAELGLTGNTAYSAYAVIFDTATVSDASKFIVTAPVSITTNGDGSSLNKGVTIGSQAGNTSWLAVKGTGPTPVTPEPTSGLLLVLGLAGLALKRKA